MLNTYGLRSINSATFNQMHNGTLRYPQAARDFIVMILRMHNAVLNVLGYIPGVQVVSGCVRMATGLAMVGVTIAIGDRNPEGTGPIIGRFCDEAIGMGIAQIARGALEALIPFGSIANAALDIIATPFNLIDCSPACSSCKLREPHVTPHEDASYIFPFQLLHLV